MILLFVFGFFLVVFIVFVLKNKIHVDFVSFLKPTLPLIRGQFGVYCFTGKQGTGKTYSLVRYLLKNAKGKKIYSNVTILGLEYTKLHSVEQLLDLVNEWDCYIVYDEIFTLLSKDSKLDAKTKKKLKKFLSQMRKHHNIFLTTAQEWLDLPIDFRRFVRIQIQCSTRPLGKYGGILTESYFDAYNMVWDNLANEYIAPIIDTKISKYERKFMLAYDTEEVIDSLAE